MKQISLFTDDQEYADFLVIKERMNRKTESDTIRAMIAFCKKFFPDAIAIDIKKDQENIQD